jgi:hypothetical protein
MNTSNPMQWMEDIQKNISDLIARSPAADVERNVRAMLTQGFSKLDLVTREEFDVQADLLARTLTRLEQLTVQVGQLEARLAGTDSTPPAAGGASQAAGSTPGAV